MNLTENQLQTVNVSKEPKRPLTPRGKVTAVRKRMAGLCRSCKNSCGHPRLDGTTVRSDHPRNTLTVPRMSARHTAQLRNAGEQVSQQTRCPQGRKTVLTSLSMHTLHVLTSRRRRFSSNSASQSDVFSSALRQHVQQTYNTNSSETDYIYNFIHHHMVVKKKYNKTAKIHTQ